MNELSGYCWFFFKQKTAYEMRIRDWSSDVCSSDLCARDLGGRTAPCAAVTSRAGLDAAIAEIGCPAILKTTRFGYDGKGQARLASADDADAAWEAIGGGPAVLAGFVRFDHEFSIVQIGRASCRERVCPYV